MKSSKTNYARPASILSGLGGGRSGRVAGENGQKKKEGEKRPGKKRAKSPLDIRSRSDSRPDRIRGPFFEQSPVVAREGEEGPKTTRRGAPSRTSISLKPDLFYDIELYLRARAFRFASRNVDGYPLIIFCRGRRAGLRPGERERGSRPSGSITLSLRDSDASENIHCRRLSWPVVRDVANSFAESHVPHPFSAPESF